MGNGDDTSARVSCSPAASRSWGHNWGPVKMFIGILPAPPGGNKDILSHAAVQSAVTTAATGLGSAVQPAVKFQFIHNKYNNKTLWSPAEL